MTSSPNPNLFEMADIKNLFGKLSLTNYYQVDFNGLSPSVSNSTTNRKLIEYLKETTFRDIPDKTYINTFITEQLGLLCTDASLPSSSYATSEVKDNFMGVTQEFAHTRLFTDADFTFYVDSDYSVLRFLEGWMDFISGAGESQLPIKPGYYRRYQYPDDYKINFTVTKFERNYKLQETKSLVYTFINAFPKTLTPIPISYGSADLLKITASFNYDRYIVERKYVNQDIEFLQKQFERQITGATGGGTLTGSGTFSEVNQGLA
jgi:hypothetical protein